MKHSKLLTKISALLLTVAVLLGFSSCADTSYAAKSGDDTVSAGVYLGILINSYYTAASNVEDTETDLFSQKIDGVAADEYIKNLAEAGCKEIIAVDRLFDEYKLSFTDEEMEEFNSSINQIWPSIEAAYIENGCGKESFKKINLMEEKKNKIFEYYYSKDGKEPVSEDTLKKEFKETCTKIKFIAVDYQTHFDVETADKATDEQKTELKAAADKYVQRLKNGEDIHKLIAEEEALGKDDDDNSTTAVEEVDYTFIQKDTSDSPSQINADIFKAAVGVPTVIENSTTGYYVIVREDVDENSEEYDDHKFSVLSSLKGDEFDEVMVKAASEVKITMNSAAVKRFKPQNITLS